MKFLLLPILILLLVGCVSTPVKQQETERRIQVKVETTVPPEISEEQYRRMLQERGDDLSKLGYIFEGMTKEQLEDAGYTEYTLLEYKKSDNEEWMMFSDWITPEYGDAITFYLVDGKVVKWVRDKEIKKMQALESEI
jgi:hypothetical protein